MIEVQGINLDNLTQYNVKLNFV